MMDENLHHTEGEDPGAVVENSKLRSFTESEIETIIESHLQSWDTDRGWRRLFSKVFSILDLRKRNRLEMISVERQDGMGFDISIRVKIDHRTSLHSKMLMLTIKWLVDKFVKDSSKHDQRTLNMINSMPFIMLTEVYDEVFRP